MFIPRRRIESGSLRYARLEFPDNTVDKPWRAVYCRIQSSDFCGLRRHTNNNPGRKHIGFGDK
jgi:hypothetical protein